MIGRTTSGVLLAICCLMPQSVSAQNGGNSPTWYSRPETSGNPALSNAGYFGAATAPIPAVTPTDPRLPMEYANFVSPQGNAGYYGHDQFATTPFEQDDNSFELSPLEAALSTAISNSWMRLDYLFWTIGKPGNQLLGTEVPNIADPRVPFNITNPVAGTTRVLDLAEIDLRDNSGIRGTIGIPLTFGTLEASAFLLEQSSDTYVELDLPNTGNRFISTTTTFNGMETNIQRGYNQFFSISYASDLWGADANIVFDTAMPGEGVKFRPIAGFRFLSLEESLTQKGISDVAANFTTLIDSDTINNIYGVNVGMESAIEHRWFTLGFRPSVMAGLNSYRNRVMTDKWVSATDPKHKHELTETDFAAAAELAGFIRVPIRDNFNLHASVNGLWLFRVQRPGETIIYDTNAVGNVPVSSNFQARKSHSQLKVYGFTVGGEIIWK